MEENDVLTILFEISCAEEKNGLRTYVYTPVEVVEGKELSGNNGTILQVPRLKRKVESRYLNQETKATDSDGHQMYILTIIKSSSLITLCYIKAKIIFNNKEINMKINY